MRTLAVVMMALAVVGGAVQAANLHDIDNACVELHDGYRLPNLPPSTEAPIRHMIPMQATMPDGLESFTIKPRLA